MTKAILFLLGSCIPLSIFCQAPVLEWANQMGLGYGNSINVTTDGSGNVYITGFFDFTVDFDPGPEVYNLTALGIFDIFVAKYDDDGQLVWALSFGDSEGDAAGYGIATDSLGQVYVTGEFIGIIDFDPGSAIYSLTSDDDEEEDIFILKLNTDGHFIWAKSLGGSGTDIGHSIIVDGSGNVYTAGLFLHTTDFDPGAAFHYINANGSFDAFILKLNSEGDFVWVNTFGGSSLDSARDIALDSNNNVYTTGRMGGSGLFVSKLNSDGEILWTKTTDGPSINMWGYGIAVDDGGNVYTIGEFEVTVDFDPGTGVHNLLSNGDDDIFILKFNANGEFIWAKAFGGGINDIGRDIALDKYGNLYAIGQFRNLVDFDPGSDVYYLTTNETSSNVFILKLNTDGNFIWAGSFTGDGFHPGRSIALDNWNNIYTTGEFSTTTDFDPSDSTYYLTANGNSDIFLHKMRQPCLASPLISAFSLPGNAFAICPGDSITLLAQMPGGINASYYWSTSDTTSALHVAPDTSTSYTLWASYTHDTSLCMVSTYAEVLVYDPILISIPDELEYCQDEEVWLEAGGGIAWLWSTGDTTAMLTFIAQSSQTYSVTVSDANNCTAEASTFVTVYPLSDTLQLAAITCDSLAAGTFTYSLADQNGCDSIVIEALTYLPLPATPLLPDSLLIEPDEPPFQITVPEIPTAIGYSWTIPAGAYILSGEGSNSITLDWGNAVSGGLVCVQAVNECGDGLMACMMVLVDMSSATEEPARKGYVVFPNPADEVIHVHFDFAQYKVFEEEGGFVIALLDVLGREMPVLQEGVEKAHIATKELPAGTYWLQVKMRNEVYWERVEVVHVE